RLAQLLSRRGARDLDAAGRGGHPHVARRRHRAAGAGLVPIGRHDKTIAVAFRPWEKTIQTSRTKAPDANLSGHIPRSGVGIRPGGGPASNRSVGPEAAELYHAILKAKPDDFDCLHLIGVIYHQRGDHEQAVRHIDAALKINPRLPSAYNNRGSALSE